MRSPLRRLRASTSCLALMLFLAPPAHPEGRAVPELGPLISGTTSYVRGHFVWTDYVLDDRGDIPDL